MPLAAELLTRRGLLRTAGAGLAATALRGRSRADAAPSSPVAIERCRGYGQEFALALERAVDRIGGIGSLVSGKTVALKINLTGEVTSRPNRHDLPWRTHPDSVLITAMLLARNGARRVRILESFIPAGQELALWARYDLDVNAINNCGCPVEWENTNYLGRGASYKRLAVPGGGYIYPAFDMNHSYEDCDVYVSLALMKNHRIAGITLSIKNSFGIAPCSLYGGDAYPDGNEDPKKVRSNIFHNGETQPAAGAPAELDPNSSRDPGHRVPRITTDLLGARPIDLAIIDGVSTIRGGEGPWNKGVQWVRPGVLLVGRNPVCTDAVSMAVMGYDPRADRGAAPFVRGDNTLKLAEARGIGTTDLSQIEVAGLSIEEACFGFGPGPVGEPVEVPGAPLAAWSAARPSGMLAPGSLISVYGRDISGATQVNDSLDRMELNGVRLEVTDSAGAARTAYPQFVSPQQANFVLPEVAEGGRAELALRTSSGATLRSVEQIFNVAPAIFTANGSGAGVAAAYLVRNTPQGQRKDLIFACAAGQNGVSCEPVPVDLGPSGDAVLELYATGVRNAAGQAAVRAWIGGKAADVLYAGPQPEFPGLDQINLRLPPGLTGLAEVIVEAEGTRANIVTLSIGSGAGGQARVAPGRGTSGRPARPQNPGLLWPATAPSGSDGRSWPHPARCRIPAGRAARSGRPPVSVRASRTGTSSASC